jgi:hypothetical protein
MGQAVNWDVIGAIATVLGVLGGFVSVYFLIHEVRRNALAIEGSTVQSLMTYEQSVWTVMIDNAAVFTKGSKDRDGLTVETRFKFDMLVQCYMSLSYSAFKQHEQGLIDDEVWHAYENGLRLRMSDPGFAASWAVSEFSYPKSFQNRVIRVCATPADNSGCRAS